MKGIDLPEIKLTYNQKLILQVLEDEFHGSGFGPQMLEETENPRLKELSINQITWNILRLRENGLVTSEKKEYKGRILNKYSTTPVVNLKAIIFK